MLTFLMIKRIILQKAFTERVLRVCNVQSTLFHTNLEVYVGLERYVEAPSTSSSQCQRKLHITAEHDCRRLHCSLRDLSSVLQALGRLTDHFIGDDKFTASFDDARVLIDRSLCVLSVGGRSPGCFFWVLPKRSIPKPDQHRKDIM